MLKRLFWLCFLLGCQAAVFAQSKFQPGYVVLFGGDTLRGEIEYGTAQGRAQRVRMRAANAVKDYLPAEARGYGYVGRAHYEAQRLPGLAGAPVFVEALVRSEASLYLLVDDMQEQRFFFRKPQDAALTELISRDTVVERMINGTLKNMKLRDTRYRITLHQAFGDCETVQSRIDQTAFTESDLRRVFREYAACKATLTGTASSVVESAHPAARVRLRVFAGAQRTQLNFADNSFWRGAKFSSRISPVLGAGLVFHPARFNEKLSIIPQVYWTNVSINRSSYSPPSANTIPTFTATQINVIYDVHFVRLPVVARWTLGHNPILRPFLQAGGEVSQVVSGRNYSQIEETRSTGQVVRSIGLAFGELRRTAFGFTSSVGLSLPATDLEIELRYSRLDGISQAIALTAPPQMLSMLLSYTFGKQR